MTTTHDPNERRAGGVDGDSVGVAFALGCGAAGGCAVSLGGSSLLFKAPIVEAGSIADRAGGRAGPTERKG
jgi:hypothetical protein